MEAKCLNCGENYPTARQELGYDICLDCGEKEAKAVTNYRKKCIVPAYNKGAYQYVWDKQQVIGIHRKGG